MQHCNFSFSNKNMLTSSGDDPLIRGAVIWRFDCKINTFTSQNKTDMSVISVVTENFYILL